MSIFQSETPKETLEQRVKKLEGEIFSKEKEKEENDPYGNSWFYPCFSFSSSLSLKEQVDSIIETQAKDRKLLDMLMEKLGLEYVKITEENGDKKVRETLRKKPVKKKKVSKS